MKRLMLKIFLFKEYLSKHMQCYFCQRNINEINFKEIEILKRFLSPSAKIRPRKKTGLCSFHQRKIAKAIKRAQNLGFLPFTR